MTHADLVGRVDRLPPTTWTAEVWRHVATGRSPLSGEGARIAGGRWNPAGSFAVLYLGSTRATVVAEFHRLATRQRIAPEDFLPRTLYRYAVNLSNLLDLREDDALDVLELRREQIELDDLETPRAIGHAAFTCGREGILARSVTRRGDVLAVYPERLQPASYVRDEELETWEHVPTLDPLA